MSLEDLRTAIAAGQRRPGQGQLRRTRARPTPSAPTTSCLSQQRLPPDHRRLQQRRPGARSPTWPPSSTAPENVAAGRVDEHHARGDPQHPAPARRQHHQRRRPHQEAAASSCRPACRPRCRSTVLTDRTTTIRASRQGRAVRADAHHRAGGDGDLPVPAQRCRPPSSPASPCRCRWSAPSA